MNWLQLFEHALPCLKGFIGHREGLASRKCSITLPCQIPWDKNAVF